MRYFILGVLATATVVTFAIAYASSPTVQMPSPLPCAHVRVEKRWKSGPVVELVIRNGLSIHEADLREAQHVRYGTDYCTLDSARQLDVCHPNGFEIIETCVDNKAALTAPQTFWQDSPPLLNAVLLPDGGWWHRSCTMKNIVTLCAAAYASSKGHGFWDHDKGCLYGGCHVMIPGEMHEAGVREPNVECTSLFMHAHHEPFFAGSSYADAPGPCTCVNRDPLMKLMLIHSELSEALEEYRLGEAKHGGPLGTMIYECKSCGGERYDKPVMHCANVHAASKPVGFMSELADVAIRVFDLAQACDESATAAVVEDQLAAGNEEHASGTRGLVDMLGVVGTMDVLQQRLSEQRAKRVRTTFSRKLYFAHYLVTGTAGLFTQHGYTEPGWSTRGRPPTYEAVGEKLGSLLESVEELALNVSGDIDQAIEIKMAYNTSRPFRHGGKTC